MRHFAPAETQGNLYLVTVFQKFEHAAHLHIVIVLVRIGPEFDFLDLDDLLLLTGLGLFLLGFVLELAVVHDLADRRRRIRRDFDKVEPGLFGHRHGPFRRHHTDVFAFGPDEPDFAATDGIVDPGAGVALWWRVMWSASYGLYPLIVSFS